MRLHWIAAFAASLILALSSPAQAGPRNANLTGVLNLNTATQAELQLLPGIGAKKAERIIEVRQKRKFETAEQIRRVKGIGRGTFRRLKPYLAVNGNTTLAVSAGSATAPAETKESVPATTTKPGVKTPPKAAPKPAKTPAVPKAPARA